MFRKVAGFDVNLLKIQQSFIQGNSKRTDKPKLFLFIEIAFIDSMVVSKTRLSQEL